MVIFCVGRAREEKRDVEDSKPMKGMIKGKYTFQVYKETRYISTSEAKKID